jgi:hypothetical protein
MARNHPHASGTNHVYQQSDRELECELKLRLDLRQTHKCVLNTNRGKYLAKTRDTSTYSSIRCNIVSGVRHIFDHSKLMAVASRLPIHQTRWQMSPATLKKQIGRLQRSPIKNYECLNCWIILVFILGFYWRHGRINVLTVQKTVLPPIHSSKKNLGQSLRICNAIKSQSTDIVNKRVRRYIQTYYACVSYEVIWVTERSVIIISVSMSVLASNIARFYFCYHVCIYV